MNTPRSTALPAPPSLLRTLLAGFNSITEHILLILFPIGLDLVIWFGPRLKISAIIKRMVHDLSLQSRMLPADTDTTAILTTAQEMWMAVGEKLNLMVFLRSFPVGIPSLMTSVLPVNNPLGVPGKVEIASFLGVAGIFTLLGLAGLVFGSLYYSLVAQAAVTKQVRLRQGISNWLWSSLQVILLALIWLAVFLGVSVPASCAISLAALGSLTFGQCGMLLYAGLLVWVIFPLLFSAHGIFVNRKEAWLSIKQGVLITRMTLPSTTLFFLVVILLSQGFDLLWRIPPENSWLMLLGLAGHAFVSTGLLSTSFVYYRDADQWVMTLKNRSLADPAPLENNEQS